MKAERTEEIINSLDGVKRAEANPYLYNKILNRLQQAPQPVLRLAWTLAWVLLIVAVLNAVTLLSGKAVEAGKATNASVIANEYEINLSTYY